MAKDLRPDRGVFCCETMQSQVEHECDLHEDPNECADKLVGYWSSVDEYGILVHDGGSSRLVIQFCPWCGTRLPDSKRDRWADELERLGFDQPLTDEGVPPKYFTDEWYRE